MPQTRRQTEWRQAERRQAERQQPGNGPGQEGARHTGDSLIDQAWRALSTWWRGGRGKGLVRPVSAMPPFMPPSRNGADAQPGEANGTGDRPDVPAPDIFDGFPPDTSASDAPATKAPVAGLSLPRADRGDGTKVDREQGDRVPAVGEADDAQMANIANAVNGTGQWPWAAVLALLLVAGPGVTLVLARQEAARARADAAAIAEHIAPRQARAAEQARARTVLSRLLERPTMGATLELLAGALPPDARVTRVGRDAAGQLRVEIDTPDPDALRAALRHVPALAALRETGQQRGDAGMRVILSETSPDSGSRGPGMMGTVRQ